MVWDERLLEQRMRDDDIRSESDRDYARIIHSAAFRRLQSKTQILGLGESDFYRTRLTHSMEVCQIGVGIMKYLEIQYYGDREIRSVLPETNLIGAICLAHDIGHSPFGHSGESALNSFMLDDGGFESNAQTLRILARLEKYTKDHGLNPTRRIFLGVLKYPASYSSTVNRDIYKTSYVPPKCYYDMEKNIVEWILSPLTDSEKELFQKVISVESAHSKTLYKSLDTSIMELADDISYGLHDFEDAVALDMITKDMWHDFFDKKCDIFRRCNLDYLELSEDLFSKSYKRKDAIGKLVNKMITGAIISPVDGFVTPLVKYNAYLKDEASELLSYFIQIVRKYVINNDNVKHLDFKCKKLISELFKAYIENPQLLLSQDRYEMYVESGKDRRVICDYIAGMTDDYATKMYEKLFIPGKGSIFDRI